MWYITTLANENEAVSLALRITPELSEKVHALYEGARAADQFDTIAWATCSTSHYPLDIDYMVLEDAGGYEGDMLPYEELEAEIKAGRLIEGSLQDAPDLMMIEVMSDRGLVSIQGSWESSPNIVWDMAGFLVGDIG